MSDVDVVVIGAGAAGLGAARQLMAAGRTFKVVEAMNRIGGRAWTTSTDFGVPFDIGCAWLHAADRNPFYPEAQAAGWTLFHHDMGLDHLYYGDRKADAADLAAISAADAELQRLIEAHDGANDRLSSLLAKGHALRAAATFSGPMDFGQDDDEISIADFRAAADLDPNYFTKEGFGALVARFGADVPVELATLVREIDWSGSGVAVETTRGTLRARAAIVTVSTGVLAFEDIRFRPHLPEAHTEAIFDLPMGLLTKIPVEIRGDRLGLSPFDDLLIERHARHDVFFLCFPFDLDLMVGFVGGDFAWEIEAAGQDAAVDFVTDRLVDVFGSNLRPRIGRSLMTNWGGERLTRGAYAAARPGKAAARQTLAQPVGDRIWFAGEALAGPLIQTAGGARLSGEAAAREVIAQLG
ncbi:flavin monoamine oxidase family protein [Seohaeicola zhoushanensis]|uniref:Tryptophan 2-monooxygenase n=1 Tax=Seohaeicola zhoushanensis TaxID=1569283 RepID=A0A8J3M8E8_9RHOB|nr:NAD(P)/FAD-dependent oxidoreductase [Seohaeicola zhoushanensis]GHF58688.1 amine oxidase [Seohaeicola zhoushanensis]